MAALAVDLDFIGADGSGIDRGDLHLAQFNPGCTVEAEAEVDIVHDAVLHQLHSPARQFFFRGLEHQLDGAADQFGMLCQNFRKGKQRGRMGIVTAGVHDIRCNALIRKVILLVDRQRVKVCPAGNHRTVLFPLDDTDDGCAADAFGQRNAQFLQLCLDIGGCFILLKTQFRMHMKVVSCFPQRFLLFCRELFDEFFHIQILPFCIDFIIFPEHKKPKQLLRSCLISGGPAREPCGSAGRVRLRQPLRCSSSTAGTWCRAPGQR